MLAAAFAIVFSMNSAVSAYAVGPGESATITDGTAVISSDAWSGYTNADGSAFTYLEKGTEVSKFQNQNGAINWNKVKAAGISFVMVRISYGTTKDAYFDTNVQGALAAGLHVGAYVCSTATNMEETMAEAALAVSSIKPYALNYPVAYDVEVNSMLSAGATRDGITAMANAFCKAVKDAGYTPIVYANKTWLTQYMNASGLGYDVWFASYASDKVYRPVSGVSTTIWQSSEKGTVDGIKGYVTTEFSKKNYSGAAVTTQGPAANAASSQSVQIVQAVQSTTQAVQSTQAVTETQAAQSTEAAQSSGTVVVGGSPVSGSSTGTAETAPAAAQNAGWVKAADGTWSYYENNIRATGWKLVDGKWYYMNAAGVMLSSWAQIDGAWYWLGADGAMRIGWKQIGNVWYYMDPVSGKMLQSTAQIIDGKVYNFAADGAWISG